MRLFLLLVAGLLAIVLALPLLVAAAIATHPWLAVGFLVRPPTITLPPLGGSLGVPPTQWALMLEVAASNDCGVSVQDLAGIAQVESSFGTHMSQPGGAHFGYGQFDAPTWAAFGAGDPANPADALPAIARTLCARGYATN